MTLKPSDWLLDPHSAPGFLRHEVTAHREAVPYTHHTEQLYFEIPKRYALVNITEHVAAALARSGVEDGLCFVSAMHITAGIYINDAESGLLHDISKWIEKLAPFGENYQHHQIQG